MAPKSHFCTTIKLRVNKLYDDELFANNCLSKWMSASTLFELVKWRCYSTRQFSQTNFMQGLGGHSGLKDFIAERFDSTNISGYYRFRFRSKWAWYLTQEQNTNVSRPSYGDEFKQELSDND
jgi:hypothetical protein